MTKMKHLEIAMPVKMGMAQGQQKGGKQGWTSNKSVRKRARCAHMHGSVACTRLNRTKTRALTSGEAHEGPNRKQEQDQRLQDMLQLCEQLLQERNPQRPTTDVAQQNDRLVTRVGERLRDTRDQLEELERELETLRGNVTQNRKSEAPLKETSGQTTFGEPGSDALIDLKATLQETIDTAVKRAYLASTSTSEGEGEGAKAGAADQESEAQQAQLAKVQDLELEQAVKEKQIAELQMQIQKRDMEELQLSVMQDKLQSSESLAKAKERELLETIQEKEKTITTLEQLIEDQEKFVASVREIEVAYATSPIASENLELKGLVDSRLLETEAALAEVQSEKEALLRKVEEAESKCEALMQSQDAHLNSAVDDTEDAVFSKLHKLEYEKKIEIQQKEIQMLQGMLDDQEQMTARLRTLEIASSTQSLPGDISGIPLLENTSSDLLAANAEAEARIMKLQNDMQDMKDTLVDEKVEELTAYCRSLEEDLAKQVGEPADLEKYNADILNVKAENAELKDKLQKVETKLEKAVDNVADKLEGSGAKDVDVHIAQIRELEIALAQMSSASETDTLARELTEARMEIEKLRNECTSKEKQIEEMTSKMSPPSEPKGASQQDIKGNRDPPRNGTRRTNGFVRNPQGTFLLRRKVFLPKTLALSNSNNSRKNGFVRNPAGTFVLRKKYFTPKGKSQATNSTNVTDSRTAFKRDMAGTFVLRKKTFIPKILPGKRQSVADTHTNGVHSKNFERPPVGSFKLQKKQFNGKAETKPFVRPAPGSFQLRKRQF